MIMRANTAHSAGADWWRPQVTLARSGVPTHAGRGPDSAIPFAALMAFTFILLLSPQSFIPGLARARIALIVGAFAVGAHCWTRFAARRPLMRYTKEMRVAVVLLSWAIVTIPFSIWPGGSVRVLSDLYLKALIVFWLLANTVSTLERLRAVAWGLSLMALPLAATALQNFALHRDLAGASLGPGGRIFGYDAALTQNPNDLALMLNLILPLTIGLFFSNRRPMARGLLAGLIALDASAIVVTFSRGGFLSLLTTFFLYLHRLYRSREKTWVVIALVLAVAIVPLLPQGYLHRIDTITNIQADQTGSAGQRWDLTRAALIFVVNHPLIGAGLGMNQLAVNEILGPIWHDVHNVYLEYAVDLGWVGFTLFLVLLLTCIQSAARVRDRSASLPELSTLSALAEAIRIALTTFAVAALFSPVAYSFYFYYFAGLAVALPTVYSTRALAAPGRA